MASNCGSPPAPKCPAGIPPWVLTFADLMSLLLAFFVLLFSFSEMDQQKYKQVAGSMRDAFGIQREINVKDPPKGINIIAQEFSAGKPDESTPLNEMRQITTDDFRQYLEIPKPTKEFENALKTEKDRLRLALEKEINEGFVEVDIIDETIVIRILERGSFASASTKLIEPFRSMLEKMAQTIGSNPGSVVVAGHTDSKPISNQQFRSNWELSASRAVTVVHELMRQGSIPKNRFRVEGYADIKPVDTNDTPEGRARNRRVEVTLVYDQSLGTSQPANPDAVVETPPLTEGGADAGGSAEPVQAEMTGPMESILIDPCPGCDR
jgi:chemotaxis protein MotB